MNKTIKQKGYIATQEDYDIINMIALWKINREIEIDPETIEYINAIAKTVKSPKEALTNPDVKDCLEQMLNLRGIRLPMASAILHFYQPNAFPIIDERSYRQIFGQEPKSKIKIEEYLNYIKKCIELSNKYGIPFDKIDKILYQKDKDEKNKLNTR